MNPYNVSMSVWTTINILVLPSKVFISITTIHAHIIRGNAMLVFNNIQVNISTMNRTKKWHKCH